MRLARALAAAGVCSRREAEDHIRAGRVLVNGAVITDVATNVDPLNDVIEHDGVRIYLQRPAFFVLYKPEGVITTMRDTHGRTTVRDLLPGIPERVYPVGRLDSDASGVLLLTNDGDLAYRLTHPKFRVKKTYRVTVEGKPGDYALRRLARGIVLERDERKTAPARISVIRGVKGGTVLRITVHEGRKHEIKRMCEKIGHPCQKLVREKFAGIDLSGLSPGQHRELTFKEVRKLRRLVAMEADVRDMLNELRREALTEAPTEEAAGPAGRPAPNKHPRDKRSHRRDQRGDRSRQEEDRRPVRKGKPDRASRGRHDRQESEQSTIGPPPPPRKRRVERTPAEEPAPQPPPIARRSRRAQGRKA